MIDSYAEFNAMKRILADYDLRLVMDNKCQVPYTSGTTVVVPPLPYDATREDKIKWLGIGYHEAGHHGAEVKDIWDLIKTKEISMDSFFGRVINIIEDVRNEQSRLGDYRGRDTALSEMTGLIVQEMLAKFDDPAFSEDTSPEWEMVKALRQWSLTHRGTWQPHVTLPAEKLRKHSDAELVKKLDPFLPRLGRDQLVTAEDVYQLAKDVIEALGADPKEEEKKAQEEKKSGKSKGGDEGDGECCGKISYKDLMGHDHSEPSDEDSWSIIEYDHDWSGKYTPHTNVNIHKNPPKTPSLHLVKLYEDGSKLSGKVKRLFQGKAQTRHEYYKREGKLSTRDLYRVPTGSTDVFKRKYATLDPKGTAVSLLVDASGSMFPTRWSYACAACSLFVDALSPLHIPMQVATFSEDHDGLDHALIKDFMQPMSGRDTLKGFAGFKKQSIQNADGDSLLWAYRELMRRSEQRKILIVLSDGSPACDRPGDAAGFLKNVVKEISKRMEVYAIGIQSDSVKHFYKDYAILDSPKELEACLLNVIKRKLL